MGVTELVFELKALKAKIKGAFSRSYCCYGKLLCHKINSNVFPDDWAVCWYHDVGVNKYRVVITMTHQTPSLEKYWKRVVWILVKPLTFFVNTETSSQPPWSLWLTMSCRWFWRTNAFGLNDIAHFLFEGAILRTILTWLKWKTEGKVFLKGLVEPVMFKKMLQRNMSCPVWGSHVFSCCVVLCSVWQIVIESPWVRKISWNVSQNSWTVDRITLSD